MNDYCMQCMKPLPMSGVCPDCGGVPAQVNEPHQLIPGTILNGRYLVGNVLGQGGFGITYIGRDTVLDERVAIKEYYLAMYANRNTGASNEVTASGERSKAAFEKGKSRFLTEARVLAKYRKEPGVVDVMNYFEANGTAYIVMDFLDGQTLLKALTNGPLPVEWVFAAFAPVMDALEKMHADGVVHRDVSPDNVMLLKDGSLQLMDFGAARAIDYNAPRNVSVMLKVGYTPEEQYRGDGDQGPWTDIYALSATLYKCITGITPDGSLQRVKEDTMNWPSDMGIPIPPSYEAVLKKGLAPHAEDRYQSIAEMRKALEGPRSHGTRYIPASVTTGGSATEVIPSTVIENFSGSVKSDETFCPHCGFKLMRRSTFCSQCGKRVEGISIQPVPAGWKALTWPQEPRTEDMPKGSFKSAQSGYSSVAKHERISTPAPQAPVQSQPGTSQPAANPQATRLTPDRVVPQQQMPYGQQQTPYTPPTPVKAQKSNAGKIAAIVAGVVAVVLVAVLGVGALNSGGEADSDSGDGSKLEIPEVRSSLEEYSWSEISWIADEISSAEDQDAAIEIAKTYNLVDSKGKLNGLQTKDLIIDGKAQTVRIIGFYHDNATGGGKAGITFQFVDCVGARQMYDVRDTSGGWKSSGVRSWLNDDLFEELPNEIRTRIVAVDKATNNVGKTDKTSDVNITSDKIWVPSRHEVFGDGQLAVLNAEGDQYQVFHDLKVSAEKSSPILQKTYNGEYSSWWLRSPSSKGSEAFIDVYSSGEPNLAPANTNLPIAPCFCM